VRRLYFDDAGSAPVLTEVSAALRQTPEGNPSSLHAEGRAARSALDSARDVAATIMGADRTEITFTSSGTEAVNLAIIGAARRLSRSGPIVTWAAEHQAVLGAVRHLESEGHRVEIAKVDQNGRADPDSIPNGASLVSIGLANNEVGSIQPVAEVVKRAHDLGALVHLDACAGPRWIPIPRGADLISLSGHKLGADRGGMLFVRQGVWLEPLMYGGPQEWGRRAGYEDVPAAVATATALAVCERERGARASVAAEQTAWLRELLLELGGRLTGAAPLLPNFATCAFADRRGEDVLLALDLAGVAASSGSACASGSLDPSHVLLAMGLGLEEALGSLRLSTGYDTTGDDVSRARAIITAVLTRTSARA
jgi:cysteine desulfurase